MATPEERLDRIETLLQDVATKLDQHLDDENKLTPKLDELLTTFSQAKGIMAFIKILASIAASLAAAWLFLRDLLVHYKG